MAAVMANEWSDANCSAAALGGRHGARWVCVDTGADDHACLESFGEQVDIRWDSRRGRLLDIQGTPLPDGGGMSRPVHMRLHCNAGIVVPVPPH